jgi:hypothetical protein
MVTVRDVARTDHCITNDHGQLYWLAAANAVEVRTDLV